MYSSTDVVEARALENMQLAIDMQEIFERVSLRKHKSYLVHGCVIKVTKDIIRVSDVQKFRCSKLELHNAEVKRVADRGASRTLELRDSGKARTPQLKHAEGPVNLTDTKGYSTTFAISAFKKIDARATLLRGTSEVAAMPESRVRERLFGEGGPGRSKALSTGLHLSQLGGMYDPRCDSVVKAFVRLLG